MRDFGFLKGVAAACALVLMGASNALFAQEIEQTPTVYSAEFDGTEEGTVQTVRRGKPLVEITLRPADAVTILSALDADVSKRAAVNGNYPFKAGAVLYGTNGREGLYCDLMRNRGLGSSTACLRDNDADGVFDEAVRFDFNSGRSDMVFLTDKGKVRGGKLKAVIPLPEGIAYQETNVDEMPTGRVSLFWESPRKRKAPSSDPALIRFVLTDGNNFTGTEILSSDILLMRYTGEPTTALYHGNEITVHGFGPKGEIRYSVTPSKERQDIGFVFRGYVLNIIYY